jgi:hypothetical protein
MIGLQTAIGNWANWYLANPVGIQIGIGDVKSGGRISSSLAVIAWFDQLQQN